MKEGFRKKEKSLPPGRLDQPLADYFRENGVEAPPIEVTLLFSPHGTKADMTWMEQYYKDTDVYVPEMVNWTPEGKKRFEQVAEGGEKAKKVSNEYAQAIHSEGNMFADAAEERMRIIERNPGKKICVIDVPKGTTLSIRSKEAQKNFFDSRKMARALGHNLEDFSKATLDTTNIYADLEKEREEYMVSTLPQKLGEIIKLNPVLAEKKPLKVLIQLGFAHTTVAVLLRKRGENVVQIFKEVPQRHMDTLLPIMTRATKSLTEENNQKFAFLDAIRSFTFIGDCDNLLSSSEFNSYIKLVLRNISLKEMQRLYNAMVNFGKETFRENFERFLVRKGVPLIKNKNDAEQFRQSLK
jgi:hypothetical protein